MQMSPLISLDVFPYRFVSFLLFLVCVNGIYEVGVSTTSLDPYGEEGSSVAISSDGTIVATGALFGGASAVEGTTTGAVYIYARQGQNYIKVNRVFPHLITKANCTDQICYFGQSLSLSGDGTVLVVGILNLLTNSVDIGGAYVFRTSNGWVNYVQEALLKNTNGGFYQGYAAALSGDGKTLFSGEYDVQIWGYHTNTPHWVHQSAPLPANSHMALYSAAMDQSGNNLALGGCSLHPCTHAFIYTRTGATWQGHFLDSTSGDIGKDSFGFSVAINGIGNCVAVGDPYGVNQSGLVSVYILKNGTWATALAIANRPNIDLAIQTITGPINDFYFGFALSLSQSGNILAIGAYGLAYLYQFNGHSFVKYYATLKSPDSTAPTFGYSIALSGSANSLVVGSPFYGPAPHYQGAAFVYDVDACNKSAPVCGTQQHCVGPSNPATCVATTPVVHIPLFAKWSNKTSGELDADSNNIKVTYVLTNQNDKIAIVYLNGSAYQYAKGPNQKKPVLTMLNNRTITVTLNPILPTNKPLLLYLQSWPVGHYTFSQKFTVRSHSAADYTITNDNNFVVNPQSAPFSGIFQFQSTGISTLHLTCVSVNPKFLFFTFATLQ